MPSLLHMSFAIDHDVMFLSVDTCARHFMSSVGADTTNDANPPVAPAMKTFENDVGDVGESDRSASVRLYVTNKRALSAP
jgi:hypothetical protein